MAEGYIRNCGGSVTRERGPDDGRQRVREARATEADSLRRDGDEGATRANGESEARQVRRVRLEVRLHGLFDGPEGRVVGEACRQLFVSAPSLEDRGRL
jgi:hypothetical protein